MITTVVKLFGQAVRSTGTAILLLAMLTSHALSADGNSHPMRFGHLSLSDGLSQSNVLSILQGSDGRLWFGTENGLNSYDGYEFRHFKRERGNPNALANDFIFDIAEASDGSLWLATNGGGLAQLDRKTGDVRTYRHDAADSNTPGSNSIRELYIDTKGMIWIGTRGAGLDRFDPQTETFTHIDLGAADTSGTVFTISAAGDDALWVGGDHGLSKVDLSELHAVDFSDALDAFGDHGVRAVLQDSDGHVWVGTFGGGLGRLNAAAGTLEHYVHAEDDLLTLSGDRVSEIFEDSDGRLWVGTTQGLNLVDRSSGSVVRYAANNEDKSSLSDNDISSIYQDRTGLLWVGTKSHGVNKWNPRSWFYGYEPATEVSADRSSEPNVMAFVDDGAGTLWLGTFGDGLNAIDRASGEVRKYRASEKGSLQIAGDRVMSLMRDRNGRIWVGTMMNGITRIDPVTGVNTSFRKEEGNPNSLSANGIMTMFEDRSGLVWIGTFGGGISRYNPANGTFEHFQSNADDSNSIGSNRITSFAEDADGNMWIGTDAGGLNLFNRKSEQFHQFRHDPMDISTVASDTIYAVNIDSNGVVWVGTQGGGLDRVVGSAMAPESITFSNVSAKDGLANDVVYGVQFDDSGWVWMSTNYGISRYHTETSEIRNLHRADGLQSEEFNFGAHYRSTAGELFFGGHNGYNAFRPDDIVAATVVPIIALTGFYNGGDSARSDLPVDESETVELSWQDDNVTFEFAAMDFLAPEKNHYMYKLEGFDKDWIDLGNRRSATYTDLNDGNYLLRVRAANSEGVWNEAGLSVPVKVAAAPWDTWWAYVGYAALFMQTAVLLWLGHRRKIRREEEYSQKLELEVSYRTEKLLDSNEKLKVLNKALQESSLSDPLTGLRNRRFVFEEVSRDLDLIQRRLGDERKGVDTSDVSELVFMMIDLDNFKPINDTYGHAAGDEMLLQLRDVLLDICRRSDFVIRWGGDEFVVIANQTKPDEAEWLAERIRSSVASSNFMLEDGQIVRTTCSIGFAAYPLFRARNDESNLDQIISLADGLMYEAKKKRNAWVGMLGPNEAITSFDPEPETIESTSLLFRARREGKLHKFSSIADEQQTAPQIKCVG